MAEAAVSGQMCSLTGKRWRQWEPVRKWSAWQMRIPRLWMWKAVCSFRASSTHTPILTSMWRERLLRTILPQEPGRLFGAAPPPSWTSGPSMKGRAWRTASGTGMRRRTASVPVITDSTCPYRTGTRRSAGNLTT